MVVSRKLLTLSADHRVRVTEDEVTADLIEQNLYSPKICADLIVQTAVKQHNNYAVMAIGLKQFCF